MQAVRFRSAFFVLRPFALKFRLFAVCARAERSEPARLHIPKKRSGKRLFRVSSAKREEHQKEDNAPKETKKRRNKKSGPAALRDRSFMQRKRVEMVTHGRPPCTRQ